MKTAIIGLDQIGANLSRSLALAGESILIADRDHRKSLAFAMQCNGRARAVSVSEAIRRADIVIPCIRFGAIQDLFERYREALKGKIVVDPSNPIAPDGQGGVMKIVPDDESAGQILAALMPPGTKFVKAFASIRPESMHAAANRWPDPAVLFYAADDLAAGDAVAYLIALSGFVPLCVGGIDQSIRIEAFGDLSESGGLGKLVSYWEGRALLKASPRHACTSAMKEAKPV
ncbi:MULTISPECIES: NAD(P)-binding domain-containing protein [unclassified Caballeronia]|uniref:NADPH-dependent F420 reductase n=1 Tax=unclassified Caballeronia TaxID=2646786 RepID=UPI002864C804|nr:MULTISPECIES: NAD(P)-binding domain-containing protein [unclassified Caballeronia]MDR5823791.1 NAD(P)-binding domain-containing protein [Caballeronia sp. LZ043]MDR5881687.1 NAD(P)-binding domain-containing protein [Caballeronia sp. LZ032]